MYGLDCHVHCGERRKKSVSTETLPQQNSGDDTEESNGFLRGGAKQKVNNAIRARSLTIRLGFCAENQNKIPPPSSSFFTQIHGVCSAARDDQQELRIQAVLAIHVVGVAVAISVHPVSDADEDPVVKRVDAEEEPLFEGTAAAPALSVRGVPNSIPPCGVTQAGLLIPVMGSAVDVEGGGVEQK